MAFLVSTLKHLLKLFAENISFWDVGLALLGLFVFCCIIERLTNKGPMVWPVLGILPSVPFDQDNIYGWATNALIKCGGTFPFRGVWMGGTFGIITGDPTKIEYVVKTRFNNFPKGKSYRERFQDLLGNGIFNADDDLWKEQRRLATAEMHSPRFIEHSYQTMQELVHNKLLRLLEKMGISGETFDLQDVLLRFTFDNICTAAFGVDPGCLAIDLPEVPFARAFEEATEMTTSRFLSPPFVWKTMRILEVGPEKRLKKALEIVHDFSHRTVANRRDEKSKIGDLSGCSDILSRLMDDKNYNFSDQFLEDFCISFILAGRDTSSVALTWFFWLIHSHPEVEGNILSELHSIITRSRGIKDESLINYDQLVFTQEELNDMVYLQAALSESLRLYPAVPMEIKEAQEDDVFPDGTAVKKGARILYCIYSMARMESIWGKDCLEFKPDRWIKDGKFVSENQFKYAVFNAGPRLCVGKKFAYMQMKMVAASILLRYKVNVIEGHKAVPKVTTTLYMKHGLMIYLKPRLA